MYLHQELRPGPLDVVGDIHGEIDAITDLLGVLGYDSEGRHPQNRTLVFVGDFCDRGPDSVAVIRLAQHLIDSGRAQAVLGNHEINLLTNDAKDGSGWFFDSRIESDRKYYAPFSRAEESDKPAIRDFFNRLPLLLEREDLRIVHAAWDPASVEAIRHRPVGRIPELHAQFIEQLEAEAQRSGLLERYHEEMQRWKVEIESEDKPPPFLHAVAAYDSLQQQHNPLKVLTSGVESKTATAFYSGNRWRFSDRLPWWNTYDGNKPVLIGHYWRLFRPRPEQVVPRYSQLFSGVDSLAWHGRNGKVFCVDYSAGARWRDRRVNRDVRERFHLAAMRWPERQLVFDSGEKFSLINK